MNSAYFTQQHSQCRIKHLNQYSLFCIFYTHLYFVDTITIELFPISLDRHQCKKMQEN